MIKITKTPYVWHVVKRHVTGKVLDLGAGTAWSCLECKKLGLDVVAVDFLDSSLKALKSMHFKTVKHDLNEFPYPFENGSFDTVLLIHVIEHLYSPFKTLVEIRRILKKNGTLILACPNANEKIQRSWKGPESEVEGAKHLYGFVPKTLKLTVEKAGLNVKKYYVNVALVSKPRLVTLFQPIFKLLGQDTWFVCGK